MPVMPSLRARTRKGGSTKGETITTVEIVTYACGVGRVDAFAQRPEYDLAVP
jgi:hypothetical protein